VKVEKAAVLASKDDTDAEGRRDGFWRIDAETTGSFV
jgi:hypothetical protein